MADREIIAEVAPSTESESIVCMTYPDCDREHAGGMGGVPVHPPKGARISGCDGVLLPDEQASR